MTAPADARDPAQLSPTQRARRDGIVKQAIRMLERDNYEDIQIRDVAIRSDVALGTVYRYFASKEHLFAAALVEWGHSFQHHLDSQPLHGDGPAAQLEDLMDRIISAYERRPQFLRLMNSLEATPDPYARALFDEFAQMSQGMVDHTVAALAPDNPQAVMRTLLAVLASGLRSWGWGGLSTDDVRERTSETIALIVGRS
jgi:AcrR family transcriptional regulator